MLGVIDRRPLKVRWLLILVVAAAILPYVTALRFGFVYDDHLQIEENPQLKIWPGFLRVFSSDVWSMTGSDGTSNYYRPLMWIAYNSIFSAVGPAPWAFHLLNLLFHAAVTAVVFLLTMHLWPDRRIATISALLFAVHPAHVEPVAWIAALPELGYALFFLLALYLYVLESPMCLLCYGVSLLWKESAITFLPCVILYDLIVQRHLRFRRYASLAAVTAGYLVVRSIVLGGLAPHVLYSDISPWTNVLTALSNTGVYLTKLAIPLQRSFYYPVEFVRAIDIRVIIVLLVVGAGAWKLRGRHAWAASWILITLLPVLVVTRVAVPVAERNLYLASVGFVWLVADVLSRLGRRNVMVLTVTIVIASIAVDVRRVSDWRDDLTLWKQALRIYPEDQTIRLNIASELGRRRQYDSALSYLEEILKLNPNHLEALTSKAGLLVSQQNWPAVSETCERVFRIDKNSARCSLNTGLVAQQQGQMEAAREHFDRAYKNNPRLWQALFHQGNLALETGRFSDAARTFKSVLEQNPSAPVFNNLGSAYARMGEMEKAIAAFQTAVRIDPSFEMAGHNLTVALSESK